MLMLVYTYGSIGHGSLFDGQLGNLLRVVTSSSQDTQKTDSRLMSNVRQK